MRSRSSRLFIVLLHLVGVSTNLPRRRGSHVGIVGVNPMAILLERLELDEFEDGLDGLLRQAAEWDGDDLLLAEPFWLQDDSDGKCFGPAGFSDCGDATLWWLRRKPQWKQRRGLFTRLFSQQQQERDWGYALQLVDMAATSHPVTPVVVDRKDVGECLVNRRKGMGLGPCSSLATAWSWRINGKGVLYHDLAASSTKKLKEKKDVRPQHCLVRANTTTALLEPCASHANKDDAPTSSRLVRFSLVRYQTSAGPSAATPSSASDGQSTPVPPQPLQAEPVPVPLVNEEQNATKSSGTKGHLRTTVDLAHSHASGPSLHPELKPASQLLFSPKASATPTLKSTTSSSSSSSTRTRDNHILKGANPMLFAGDRMMLQDEPVPPKIDNNQRPTKLRKIPTHPYIAKSKNLIWTDPQTGLEYWTDLCGYLGQDRKATGRHTLVGVGQYTRTVFNIKVYGVALYVSKRDVLADPLFESYASLSPEELRVRPDFYAHLRHMPSKTDSKGGLFDRTLLLKLNMQLSTETMRSSLQADWKMLTEERKNLLINSSLKARPADKGMLQKIQSEDNPSKCSCGQIAPEEYNADHTCCARGTELVFTWRKNGDMEIRLDGRVMDIFPRPDVAEGIFYEYLRHDDPISVDFKGHVVDGFPFLLAPLAQVKGVSMVHTHSEEKVEERGFFKSRMGSFADVVSSQTGTFTDWVQINANGMANHVTNTMKSVGDSARSVSEEMERRRSMVWHQVASFPETSLTFLSSRMPSSAQRRAVSAVPSWMVNQQRSFGQTDHSMASSPRTRKAPRGRVFRSPLTRWFGDGPSLPDEIDPMIHPTTMNFTRNICLAMVHLYLLLLLIVSLPGSHNTRTKLVVRRTPTPCAKTSDDSDTDSHSEPECTGIPKESESSKPRPMPLFSRARKALGRRDEEPPPRWKNDEPANIKKSLSYFL